MTQLRVEIGLLAGLPQTPTAFAFLPIALSQSIDYNDVSSLGFLRYFLLLVLLLRLLRFHSPINLPTLTDCRQLTLSSPHQ